MNKIVTLVFVFTAFFLQAQELHISSFSTPEIDAKVDALITSMTMDEKLAQLSGIRLNKILDDGQFSIEKAREEISNGMGHFCQFSSGLTLSPDQLRDLVQQVQHFLMTETKQKIPAIFHEEAITGFATQGATTFPQQIGVACSWNPEIVKNNAASTALNMRAAGATLALSPMLDISRTAHWNRLEESYGEDAYLTSRMGVAFISGLQGDDLRTGVAATTKHFAGYGTQNQDKKELYEEYLMPHEAAMRIAGVKSVMPSYGKYNALAVAANPIMLQQILRKEVGFDGLVVSDYGAINLLYTGHGQAKNSMEAGALALNAGIDIEFDSPIAYPLLPEAIKNGLVTEELINAAVKRALIMKARLGLLDENPVIVKEGELDFDPPVNRKLAYDAACQSIVLLKNNGVLPLKNEIKKIALVGPNAATVHGLLGDYTYQSMISFWWGKSFDRNNPKLVSLKEGLESKVGEGVRILHERGCDWSAPLESKVTTDGLGDDRLSRVKMMTIKGLPQPDLQNALTISNESDVIIAAMGENIYLCGEGREREGIRLPGEQEAFVEKLIATGKPVILVLFGGRQQLVSKFENKCAAIVQAWFPGEEGGNAVADILLGNVNPSGKLCVTYPRSDAEMEINYKNGYNEVTRPQYPFGYGLSYTNYEYNNFKIKRKVKVSDKRFPISFTVKNTGEVEGTEIVQLYVSPADKSSTMKPIQLKGFNRVSLKPGEEKEVIFWVSPEQLVQYKNEKWMVEPGDYNFKVGTSCTDIRLNGTITFAGNTLFLEKGRRVYFSNSAIK